MAKILTRFTLGDTIEFIDCNGIQRQETVRLIETQIVEGHGLWVIYGYGNDLYRLNYVSEHKILISHQQLHAQQQHPGRLSEAPIS